MPIRTEFKSLYPHNWKEISYFVRFIREKGKCQKCGRFHGDLVHRLPDGRWFDKSINSWRDQHGKTTAWPDIFEYTQVRDSKVILAAAHIEHDPRISGDDKFDKIASWCQRCHLLHDKKFHLMRRRITYRSKHAIGDLFIGSYKDALFRFNVNVL